MLVTLEWTSITIKVENKKLKGNIYLELKTKNAQIYVNSNINMCCYNFLDNDEVFYYFQYNCDIIMVSIYIKCARLLKLRDKSYSWFTLLHGTNSAEDSWELLGK